VPEPHQQPTSPDGAIALAPLDGDDARTLADLLDAWEREAGGVPLVDEAERRRVGTLAADGTRADGWSPFVARRSSEVVGYAAVVAPTEPGAGGDGAVAVGDAAVAPGHTPRAEVLTTLLERLTTAVTEREAATPPGLQVWVRQVTEPDLEAAAAAGFDVERRLAILGTGLPVTVAAPSPPAGVTVRASRPGDDDEAVVAVLAAAYGAGPDGGWDLARFRERRELDWFRSEDLLLAETEAGHVLGLHWTKRRSPTVGEVHNLAVHPDGQGRGLGPVLLRAGLDHLERVGCLEVLLWVDRANPRAVELYRSQGMELRWEDVALARTFRAGPDAS
jgi:mycothiol synthase